MKGKEARTCAWFSVPVFQPVPCAALLRVNGSNSFRLCNKDAEPESRYCRRHKSTTEGKRKR